MLKEGEVSKEKQLETLNEERLKMWSRGWVQTHSEAKAAEEKRDFNDPMRKFAGTEQSRVRQFPPCKFPAPTNRYGIEPGSMWDGVDRSNGFEKKWLDA